MNIKSRTDCLFINPGDKTEIYQILGSSGLSATEPPIWTGLIANYILNKGYSAEIIDANAENLTANEVARRVQDINPLLVAIVVYGHNPSASTQVMPSAERICASIKNLLPDQKVILVGGHIASLPQRSLEDNPANFVCTGEGPITILELLQCLKATGTLDLNKVRGLMYRQEDQIVKNNPAPNIENLDEEMPGIPWHLLPMHLYKAHGWHALGYPTRKPYASIYTTLGCPYTCEFCCIQEPFKEGERYQKGKFLLAPPKTNSYRYWSPKLIVEWIKFLVENYGVKHIKFADEMYFLNARHTNAIAQGLLENDLGDWLNIWAYTRVDTGKNDEMLDLARKSGIRWFCPGIESASARVRDDIDKSFKQEDIIRSVSRFRNHGIHIIANFIVGLPEDDLETMNQTLDLAMELNTEWFNIYSAMAYPGSQLYKRALELGWRLPDGWLGFSQHSEETLPLPTKYLTGGQVLTFRDYAHKKYFSRPEYLQMLESTFGPLAVKHAKHVISKNLVRKHAEPIPGLNAQGGKND